MLIASHMERRRLVSDHIRQIEEARLERIEQAPSNGSHAMVRLLARVMGVGVPTPHAGARGIVAELATTGISPLAGLTGSPADSGRKRREKGLARSGNGPGRSRHDSISVAVPSTPEGQRLDEMVSIPHRERSRIESP